MDSRFEVIVYNLYRYTINQHRRICKIYSQNVFTGFRKKIPICFKERWQWMKLHCICFQFLRYQSCLQRQYHRASACFPTLRHQCSTNALRSVKTVRAPMEVAAMLLKRLPQLKVVYVTQILMTSSFNLYI